MAQAKACRLNERHPAETSWADKSTVREPLSLWLAVVETLLTIALTIYASALWRNMFEVNVKYRYFFHDTHNNTV
jgi:hypothetical protein